MYPSAGAQDEGKWGKGESEQFKGGGHWREMTNTKGDTASRVFVCELAAKKVWLTLILL